jgi:hypothetical protein
MEDPTEVEGPVGPVGREGLGPLGPSGPSGPSGPLEPLGPLGPLEPLEPLAPSVTPVTPSYSTGSTGSTGPAASASGAGDATVFFWVMLILSVAGKRERRGPRTDEVSKRKRVTPDWPEPGVECCICLDSYEHGKYARTARCGHAFHASCFTRLVRTATRCPLCRGALSGPAPVHFTRR